ncbi:microcin ABC transporter ATP-binding protein [Pandoraea pnomenusa]|uniref:Glutathione import ATP-binding protein GsiA n=1 Tax=Pandoraea pnomenusa TaxID=93220 RepID=A0A378YXK1_9BURK|nr:ABC transporter ATP-binding protein [Pandoraea pnomenusa]AIU29256.1 microcin ABC transporter ATP-binding protein [Pandoraea pnomenusa]SUA81882.1 Glutathione import ATP-binding protein GsiA [Pandoraea pnomenusa]
MNAPLLSIENLSVRFGDTEAVKDVSLAIARGERVALVGESGSGKSVTALAILRLLQDAQVQGRILLDGVDLASVSERAMRGMRGNDIAMIFQEPMTALNPLYPIGEQIAEALELHEGLSPKDAKARAVDLLRRTGIPEPERRVSHFPHELSGGQRQRAMIAMALACRPKLLLADEPTTALDVTIRAQIIELLLELQRDAAEKRGMAVLLITHDLNLVRRFAQRVAVMEKGVLVECADTETLFTNPQHPYTRKLIDSRPQREIHPVLPIAPVLLEAKGVAVDYATSQPGLRGWFRRGRFRAVHPVDLALRQGETLGVVGESGSGKSTLAMALLGLQRASEGQIVFHGEPLSSYRGAAQRKLRSQMQIVFQDPFGSLSPRMTIEEIVGEGLALHRPHLTEDERRARVADVLREVGIDARAMSRYPHEFSGGQRQRIAIARALVVDPQILVLDEPTSALDVSIQQQVLHLLAQLQIKYNLSYLFISHDLAVMRAMAHRVLVFRDGRLVEQGDTESVFFDPRHDYTRELVAAAML